MSPAQIVIVIIAVLIVLRFVVFTGCPCGCGCSSSLFCSCKSGGESGAEQSASTASASASSASTSSASSASTPSKEPMTPSNAPTIYYHYTAWCGYCKKMRPIWDEVKATYGDRAFFIEVDEDIVHTPTVSSYPTVIAHINDTKITYNGGYTEPALAKFVRDAIEIKAKSA